MRATNAEQAARLAEHAERSLSEQARADRDRAVRAEADAQVKAMVASDALDTARRNAYAAEINVAYQALAENTLGRARELLDRQRPKTGEEDLRGFEWRYLWQLCRGDELATFHDEGAHGAAFSPDGKLFAYAAGRIIVRESASRRVVATLENSATTLSFSPRAKLLASGHDSGVKLWDTETWQEVRSLPDTLHGSLFSADGRWLMTGVPGGFRVWNTQTWQPSGLCPGAPQARWQARGAVAFSPDSQFLITVASDGASILGDHLRVWRLTGMEELPAIRFGGIPPSAIAFSADGKHVIAGLWDGQVVVVDFVTRKVVTAIKEHTGYITAVAVASNGSTFATTSTDRTVNIWDAATFKHLARLRGHVGEVWSGAISPDGRIVVSGSAEGTTKLWSADTRHATAVLDGYGAVAGFLGGRRQIVTAKGNSWCVWTPESGARMDFPTPPARRSRPVPGADLST